MVWRSPFICYLHEVDLFDPGQGMPGAWPPMSPWSGGGLGGGLPANYAPDADKADGGSGAVAPQADSEAVRLPRPTDIAPRAQAQWNKSLTRRTLSRMLRRMRRQRDLSQVQIAQRMGVTQPQIARMESATGPWPGQETIAAYAAACGHVAVLGFFDVGPEDAEAGAETSAIGAGFEFFPLGVAGEEAGPLQAIGLKHGGIYEISPASNEAKADKPEDEVQT